jgi:hypothetical protein
MPLKFNVSGSVSFKHNLHHAWQLHGFVTSWMQGTIEHNTSYNRAQYKFPVPVQLMEVLKLFAVSG